jgi:hypothetical protein
MRRTSILIATIVITLAAATACTSAEAATPTKKKAHPSVLLALNAKNGESVAGTDGAYRVTLTNYGDVLAFTDRPIRKARRTTVASLATQWKKLFAGDSPNAALSGTTADGKSVDVAVELSQPHGDNQSVTFTVRGVGVDRNLKLPAQFADVSLFIDNVGGSSDTELVYASTFVPFDSSF